jgi:hypothetical protein
VEAEGRAIMADVAVYIDLDNTPRPVGVLRRHASRREETCTDTTWCKGGADAAQLYRRVTFNVLVSNVDDHLRNHGFLWAGRDGWVLSPAYDLNPTPTDVKARILTTNIDLQDGTCSVDLLENAAEFFGLSLSHDPGGSRREPDMAGGCSGSRL